MADRNKSEEIRLRYLYRSLILSGKARVSLESARRLVGPDCAYHLYGVISAGKNKKGPLTGLTKGTRRGKIRARKAR